MTVNNDDPFAIPEEEEYQYSGEHYAQAAPNKTSSANWLANPIIRAVIVMVGFGLLVFVGTRVADYVHHRGQQTASTEQKDIAVPSLDEAQQQAGNSDKADDGASDDALAQQQQQLLAEQQQRDAQTHQRMQALQQKNQDLGKQVDAMERALKNSNAAVSQMQQTMSTMNESLSKLQAQFEKQNKPKQKQQHEHKQPPPPDYTVQAVIPGRAWLRSDKGDTITVIQGDKVTGYGVVKNIDPQQGSVKTSSGKVFEFGMNNA